MNRIRVGIVGTGYIADFHARALRAINHVELVGAYDTDRHSAARFASRWKATAFSSLEEMLSDAKLSAVHILAPPDHHYKIACAVLAAGVNAFVEKPISLTSQEADSLLEIVRTNNLKLAVNHNFLFGSAYERLRDAIRSGELGPIGHVTINHFFELGQIRFGPFNSWMLREPGNAILEIGPHVVSALLDLCGPPDSISVVADDQVVLPGGTQMFRRWRIQGRRGATATDININLGPGFSQRNISVRGRNGAAFYDLEANTCLIDQRTPLDLDLDRYRRSVLLAKQLRTQARKTITDYLLSTIRLRNRGNPYQSTILDSVRAFYSALRGKTSLDSRIRAETGRDVVEWCNRIVQAARLPAPEKRDRAVLKPNSVVPTVLVFGGTGFIGRELIRQLLRAGYGVRAVVRTSSAVLEELDTGRLEFVRADVRSPESLKQVLEGIEFVYHLARPVDAKSWKDYQERDIEPTKLIAEACVEANVKRFIYTGTIASYYTGAKAGVITEKTPLDPRIEQRDYYARAKAHAEALLMGLYRTKNFPLVIFRPGIVIGPRGTPFHWGVGMWASEGLCTVWGDGKNKLPFVLVGDVAAAMVRAIRIPGIEGCTFNLVDVPILSGREYLEALARSLGTKLSVRYQSIAHFYAIDLAKWLVKVLTRHPDAARVPNYRDWESRTHKALFDCSRARKELNWAPASDRSRLIIDGIDKAVESWLK